MGLVISRFEVHLVVLDPTIGREIRKTRPCLVVSPDEMNHRRSSSFSRIRLSLVSKCFLEPLTATSLWALAPIPTPFVSVARSLTLSEFGEPTSPR